MSILDNAKEVARAVQEINNLELYRRVLSLHSDIIALVEENNAIRKELQETKEKLSIRGRLRPVQNQGEVVYYLAAGDLPSEKDGPFCGTCWDIDARLVRVWDYGDGSHVCDYCSNHRSRTR